MNFRELIEKWQGREIRNCPGRYILTSVPPLTSLSDLLGADVKISQYRSAQARDTILVAELDDCGLISYQRNDGSYLHTLNTPAGFTRKLAQLEINIIDIS